MNRIHPNAKIASDVIVEDFTTISEHVEVGAGSWIGSNVTICDYVKIGKNCKIFPGAVIGGIPQDLKYRGEVSYVEIGDNVTIRECVTVNRGTAASGKGITRVGDNCLLMAYVHIAHDCKVGDNVVLVNSVGLAGESDVDDYAIIGGLSGVHQFSHIGAHVMLSGGSMVSKDVPPYILAGHRPLVFGGLNLVGLRRRGFTNEQIDSIREIYRIIYQSGHTTAEACDRVEAAFLPSVERDNILNFIRSSKRGIIRAKTSDEQIDE
ncbi:MAG: acyl-ACP--UDP-N-acetylglucosamine O-acyltransferase [Bacteroidetes bacterium]|nr:acyl-ACP--UDP-N-acetylglucosamine O-acyltransferase [Bacteroidota bacterium]